MKTLLDNSLNRGNKPEIVNWGFPNYSQGETITSGFVAPTNGWLRVQAYLNDESTKGYIDGVEVYQWFDDGNSRGTTFIPISAGSTWTCGIGFETLQFFPCIYVPEPPPPPQENFTKNGTPTIVDGIYSNISNTNNIVADYKFNPASYTWEIGFKITTGNSFNYDGEYWTGSSTDVNAKYPQIGIQHNKFYMAASYDGSSWAIDTEGSAISTNTTYWIRILFDGNYYKIQYKENENDAWSDGLSITSSTPLTIPDENMAIGWFIGMPRAFSGSIDLNNTYIKINDVVVWTPYS